MIRASIACGRGNIGFESAAKPQEREGGQGTRRLTSLLRSDFPPISSSRSMVAFSVNCFLLPFFPRSTTENAPPPSPRARSPSEETVMRPSSFASQFEILQLFRE